jgi:hypothetical protein
MGKIGWMARRMICVAFCFIGDMYLLREIKYMRIS